MHGIESIRQPYGFGSFVSKAFKKVGKGIKKVIKSPIGKAALTGTGSLELWSRPHGKIRMLMVL